MKYERKISVTDNIKLVITEKEETSITELRSELVLIEKIAKVLDNTVGVGTQIRAEKRQYTKKKKKSNVWTKEKALEFTNDFKEMMDKREVAEKWNLKLKSVYGLNGKLTKRLKNRSSFSNGIGRPKVGRPKVGRPKRNNGNLNKRRGSDGLTDSQRAIIEIFKKEPYATPQVVGEKLNITRKQAYDRMVAMKKKGLIK